MSKKQKSKQKPGGRTAEHRVAAVAAPAAKPAVAASSPSTSAPAKAVPSRRVDVQHLARAAALGLGFVGGMIGLLTGLNHMPVTPAQIQSPYAFAAWISGAYGQQGLDWSQGGMTLVAGALVGAALGYSFRFSAARMTKSWAMGVIGLLGGLMLGASPLTAGVGWVAGFSLGSKI